ncbi:ribosome small subunit-dependent GTPase A [Aurantimicrobium sp. MWH-Uga1]|uniref:ribosome small subunit-dependent GTPase A n=1 Tax=Aurantimicrobium sp. MWH-Uga1 TaxID=2079575 RepID=UPI000DED4B49|nr:ribosome small subunit-dependent GTPase A [Aurantimicrobium sp. MWH-Uga1]AXE54920.1 Putative ribosome biogenesis GTPase RsgA [Aurantimicrobium sp. MWH-Uga1]
MSWWNSDSDESSLGEQYDESDIRIRPNPKANKPRTKTRPDHADAVQGMVTGVDRGRYAVLINEISVTCSRARELSKNAIVVGDIVNVVGDVTGSPGSLARIVRVEPRKTVLRRSADDTDEVERVIVANADQLLIVIAAANPEPRVRLVDRYLVAAFDAGITPLLVVTKCDTHDPSEFLANFEGLNIPIFLSGTDQVPVEDLQKCLVGHTTVAVGHSGVGKSTLVNVLVPDAKRATGHVNEVTGRGRHTSSSSICFKLETPFGNGWIIDTPGVRSFGLGHVNTANVLGAFPDLLEIAQNCPRGCSHSADSPDCDLDSALSNGTNPAQIGRLDSFRRLVVSMS